jgi:D-amino-acid dehydrogenase
MAALRRATLRRGATLLREIAMEIESRGHRATGVRFAGGRVVEGTAVIVAAGAWSDAILTSAGVRVPVIPQRGQIAHLTFADRETASWPTLMGFHSHYMLTFPGGRVVAGATREADAGFAVETTAGGVHEVLGEALRIAPGLGPARLDEVRIGLRPVTPDGRPVIGPTSREGVYLVPGHGPSGLQLAPFSGHVVAGLALGLDTDVDLAPFDPGRFSAPAAVIRKDILRTRLLD